MAVAFELGWQLAELYRPRPARIARTARRTDGERPSALEVGAPAAPEPVASGGELEDPVRSRPGPSSSTRREEERGEDLPGMSALAAAEVTQLRLDQVCAGLERLESRIATAGLDAPELPVLEDVAHEERCTRIRQLHVDLLGTLTAADFRLGKAYGLGRALADTCREPHDLASLRDQLDGFRLANLHAWIADLGSLLPPHAGHAVGASLIAWRDWARHDAPAAMADDATVRETIRALRRQGELWRALLSGEKNARDMLVLDDYLAAAGNALQRASGLLWRFLKRFWVLLVAALALAAVGLWLILQADSDPAAHIIAGAGALLTSLGITWKSTTATLGNVATKLEAPLWSAELDTAIAYAVTRPPAQQELRRERPDPIVAWFRRLPVARYFASASRSNALRKRA